MMKKYFAIVLLSTFIVVSCQQTTTRETGSQRQIQSEKETNLLIGSWVSPNPVDDKEVQGVKINKDGTAESINMKTLVYKKWWKENDKLFLVSESIGNGVTSIDTTMFEIIKLHDTALELKDRDYTIRYKRE